MDQPRILIIVPAFNEKKNISRTLEDIRACGVAADLVVIDDGSQDGTSGVVRACGVRVVALPFNLGIGGAVQTGFCYALRNGYDVAVQIDGDGQHDTAYVKDLLVPILTGKADIAVGSRFIPPFLGYRSSFVRRLGILFFASLISFLTRCRVTDPTSGFRAFNRRALALFADEYPQDYPEPESIVLAHKSGLTLKEVPVEMRARRHGHSSIRYLYTLYYMTKVTLAILLDMLKRQQKG